MNYSNIIDGMVWSYSRITCYEDCPYKFFLKYIKGYQGSRQFFSDYGSFMHSIIEKFLCGELQKNELVGYYLTNFKREVVGRAPSYKIFKAYFDQGLNYLLTVQTPADETVGVEKEIHFNIEGAPFIGYIDRISKCEDGYEVVDNKSRTLKARTHRNKPTKSDYELDRYLRQLYLYSTHILDEYGEYPKRLVFNCFRTQEVISEPFDEQAYMNTNAWALSTITKIRQESEWLPNIEWFSCRYLCDVSDECEYFALSK